MLNRSQMRSAYSGGSCQAFGPLTTTSATSYTAAGLTNGSSYCFRVTAFDACDNDSTPATIANVQPSDSTPPDPITGLTATHTGTNCSRNVSLTFTCSSSPDAAVYRIVRNNVVVKTVSALAACSGGAGVITDNTVSTDGTHPPDGLDPLPWTG